MKKFIIILPIIFLLFVVNIKAQFNPDSLQERVSRIVKNYVDSNKAALLVGIIRKEGNNMMLERKYSFGHIRVDTTSPRPDSLTIFQLGSVTKSFTATILSMLIQQGGPLNLTNLVQNHLPLNLVRPPVFISPATDTTKITILDLATHYSALPDDSIQPVNDSTTYQMMYNWLNNHRLTRPPGQCYLYSNLGVSFLGVAVTHTLGGIIDSLFIQRICNPLGMPDTRVTLTQQQISRLAQGYSSGSLQAPFHKSSWPAFNAAGGLYTTINDFLKYLKFQMGLSDLGMRNVLDSAQKMRRVTNDTCQNPNSSGRIGLVWQMNILNDQVDSTFYFTWKDGGTAGFSSYICFANDQSKSLKTGVVVLSNHLSPACDRLGVQILRYLNSDTTTGLIQISDLIPEEFELHQNYPNPFNPVTKIKFDLPIKAGVTLDDRRETRDVKLAVYDNLGKEIAILFNKKINAGSYEIEFDGAGLPSGVYYYKLSNGNFIETKKMFLVK